MNLEPRRFRLILAIGFGAGIVVLTLYWGLSKFLSDRQSLLLDKPAKIKNTRIAQPAQLPQIPSNPNNDAVQRSLKTLEDIQRINENNRRLLEQQQRLRNQ